MAIRIFATLAVIIALIETWMRPAPVATESITAAKVQTSSGPISPIEFTLKNSESLPDAYHGVTTRPSIAIGEQGRRSMSERLPIEIICRAPEVLRGVITSLRFPMGSTQRTLILNGW